LSFFSLKAQENIFTFKGVVKDSSGFVKNAHVLNLNNKIGTSTNDFGEFRIYTKIGDTIQFSSIQHQTKKKVITRNELTYETTIYLLPKIYVLDEIALKTHDLDGRLISDLPKVPIDKRAETLRKNLNLSHIDMNTPIPLDHIDKKVRPHIVKTDNLNSFAGAGAIVSIPFGYSKKLWALRKKLNFNMTLPDRLMKEIGKDYFFEYLKIPESQYFQFIDFCMYKNIDLKYKKGDLLEVIQILEVQSKEFLKVIKQESKN